MINKITDMTREIITTFGRDWRTGEFVSEEVAKTNLDRYKLVTVKAYDDKRLTMLRAIIYEPEHEKGTTCWCTPKVKIEGNKTEIQHNEQRDTVIDFVKKNFLTT